VTDLDETNDEVLSLSNYYGKFDGWPEAVQVQAEYFERGTTSSGVGAGINGPRLVLETSEATKP
jgi:hypothetical protein